MMERLVESEDPLRGKPDVTAEGMAYHLEAPEGLKAGRQTVQEREAREPDQHRRKVEDRKQMDPQVDPWVEAEARVDPLRKANLREPKDHYPMEGEDPRMALGR